MNNVDTLTLGIAIDTEDKNKIFNKLSFKYDKKTDKHYYAGADMNYCFYYNDDFNYLCVTLRHNLIADYNSEQIIKNTKNKLYTFFNIYCNKLTLNRIDYNIDYMLKNAEELTIIKNIVYISNDKFYKTYVKTILINKGFYEAKYSSSGSGYVELVLYDKETEVKLDMQKNNVVYNDKTQYRNIFRVEIRIKNKRLNYEKYYTGLSKDLDNYYNKETAQTYYKKFVKKIFGTEPFYRIDIALDKIKNEQTFSTRYKVKLCKLLIQVNTLGYTVTKKKYNIGTFNKYVRAIQQLNINILTFKRKINGRKIKTKCMQNFALLYNGGTK